MTLDKKSVFVYIPKEVLYCAKHISKYHSHSKRCVQETLVREKYIDISSMIGNEPFRIKRGYAVNVGVYSYPLPLLSARLYSYFFPCFPFTKYTNGTFILVHCFPTSTASICFWSGSQDLYLDQVVLKAGESLDKQG